MTDSETEYTINRDRSIVYMAHTNPMDGQLNDKDGPGSSDIEGQSKKFEEVLPQRGRDTHFIQIWDGSYIYIVLYQRVIYVLLQGTWKRRFSNGGNAGARDTLSSILR